MSIEKSIDPSRKIPVIDTASATHNLGMSVMSAARQPSAKFVEYINQFKTSDTKTATHTSMCPPFGSFAIPQSKMTEFFDVYESEIKVGSTIGITERPLAHLEVPVVVDIDLKYKMVDGQSIFDQRRHNFQTIKDLLAVYKSVYDANFKFRTASDVDKCFWIVSQRAEPYLVEKDGQKIVKDGWHVQNPMIKAIPAVHRRMRELVLQDPRVADIFAKLGVSEKPENIIDEAVIHRNGWLLFGSTKPGREPYDLAFIFNHELVERARTEIGISSMARYLSYWRTTTYHAVPREELIAEVLQKSRLEVGDEEHIDSNFDEKNESKKPISDDSKESKKKPKKKPILRSVEVVSAVDPNIAEGGVIEKVRCLMSMIDRKRATNKFLWLELGSCLKHIGRSESDRDKLLEIWTQFSHRFRKTSTEEISAEWDNLQTELAPELLTLKFWASQDSPKLWGKFKQNEIRQFLTRCMNDSHVDVAQTLYLMYESQFVCASVRKNTWYEFHKGRWNLREEGCALRKRISNELAQEYARFRKFCLQMADYSETGNLPDDLEYDIDEGSIEDQDKMTEKSAEEWRAMAECCAKLISRDLKTSSYKNNILAEAKELFYVEDFESKLDERHELIGFENGVVDLDRNLFREGRPDDFITFSTKTRFIPVEEYERTKEYGEIMAFLKQVYMTDEMVMYALKERAQCLHGNNTEERFFCWIGGGGNGKSKFRELNATSLNDYVVGFPVTLFTGKRAQSGAPAPEVARSKGKRMAFVDEPEENQRLNMGLVKKYSGGDPIEARHLFGNMFEFIPQFTITLLCNDPPKVPPHDDGTKRRLLCDPHDAKFVVNPNPEKANEFKRDTHLSAKMKKWVHVYASMLVQYYSIYREEGLVPPEPVARFTSQFLKECDAYDTFVSDALVEIPYDEDGRDQPFVNIKGLYRSFVAWIEENGLRSPPTSKEFTTYLRKKIRNTTLLKADKLFGYRERSGRDQTVSVSY